MRQYLLPENGKFYKANMHMHTNISDGNMTREEVKQTFLDKGYSIVAYTDHEVLVPHNDLSDENFLALTSYEVSLSEKVRITVPIYLVGEPKGVKIGGGVLEQTLRTVDIDVLPADIPEKFDVDVSALDLDQTLFVRDLALGDKYTVTTRGEVPVAVVKAPDAVPGATPAAGAADAGAKNQRDTETLSAFSSSFVAAMVTI